MAPAHTAGSPPWAGACQSGGGHPGATGPMSPPARPGPTDDEIRRRASLDMATTTSRPSRFVRLARLCNRHRWRTFLAWLLALVVIQVIASSVGTKQISSFRLPGTESQRAYDLLAQHFPAAKGDTDQLVFRARTGTLRDPQLRARIAAALKKVSAQDTVANVTSPFAPGGQLTRDGRIGVASLVYKTSTNDIQPAPLEDGQNAAFTARSPQLQVEHGGPGAEVVRFSNSQGPSEFIGVLAAAIVLLITFGSAVAAGLPLIATLLALGLSFMHGVALGAAAAVGATMFAALTIIPALIGGSGNFIDGVLVELDR